MSKCVAPLLALNYTYFTVRLMCVSLFVSSEIVAFPGLDNLKNEHPFYLDNYKTGTSE